MKLTKTLAVTIFSTAVAELQTSKMWKATSVCNNTATWGPGQVNNIRFLAPIWKSTSTLLYHFSLTSSSAALLNPPEQDNDEVYFKPCGLWERRIVHAECFAKPLREQQ